MGFASHDTAGYHGITMVKLEVWQISQRSLSHRLWKKYHGECIGKSSPFIRTIQVVVNDFFIYPLVN